MCFKTCANYCKVLYLEGNQKAVAVTSIITADTESGIFHYCAFF